MDKFIVIILVVLFAGTMNSCSEWHPTPEFVPEKPVKVRLRYLQGLA